MVCASTCCSPANRWAECCVETGIDYEIRSMEKPPPFTPPSGRPSAANQQLSCSKLGQEN
ncbi:hypothetical protein ACVXHB_16980 [Escherichia coli]